VVNIYYVLYDLSRDKFIQQELVTYDTGSELRLKSASNYRDGLWVNIMELKKILDEYNEKYERKDRTEWNLLGRLLRGNDNILIVPLFTPNRVMKENIQFYDSGVGLSEIRFTEAFRMREL